MLTRIDLENREKLSLRPYAMLSGASKGRKYPESEHEFRTVFQRDHDRIVHSAAFRRLEYKTQVFLNDMGDHYRTRLTHSLEVAGLSRTAARALGLNEDLAETVALAHDLGHTPFGHAGERILNRLMQDHGGFEHNTHTLRILTFLERKTPAYHGLNLTFETRESLIKHSPFAKVSAEYEPSLSPLLESYVVDTCDEIAYNNHDLDDGLRSGLLTDKDLETLALWQKASEAVQKKYGTLEIRFHRSRTISALINFMMSDLLLSSSTKIEALGLKSIQDVRQCKKRPICFSPEMDASKKELETFLYSKLYRSEDVNQMMKKAEHCIEQLFYYYIQQIENLPSEYRTIAEAEGLHRAVSDYIAGMTDRFAYQTYNEILSKQSESR